MSDSYSIGETIRIEIPVGDHPDIPGKTLDSIVDEAAVTLQHRVEHDHRHEFDRDDHVDLASQSLVLELPPRTLSASGRWVCQSEVVLTDGRTLVWPRSPRRIRIEESIV